MKAAVLDRRLISRRIAKLVCRNVSRQVEEWSDHEMDLNSHIVLSLGRKVLLSHIPQPTGENEAFCIHRLEGYTPTVNTRGRDAGGRSTPRSFFPLLYFLLLFLCQYFLSPAPLFPPLFPFVLSGIFASRGGWFGRIGMLDKSDFVRRRHSESGAYG